jgi:predicted aspartyl protease
MIQKYGNIDADDIRMKMDAIKQEPKERVQKYFERLDKLFRKGQIQDVEQRRRFLARLRPEIRKLCVVRVFANIEELVGATTEVERVIGELGETPYEPLREEHDEDTSESNVEKQVTALNNTLINFFKGNSQDSASSSSSIAFGGCQLCKGKDHMATACPRLNEARPKCAKCNLPHRTENCGVKCTFCTGLGHSEDKCWKKPKDGKSTAGAANFLEVMLDDEAATEQQLNKLCGNESVFSYTRVPRRRTPIDMAPGGIAPVPEAEREGTSMRRDVSVKSKILSHFIKGKFSLSPMEIVLMIPGELEHLENLVKLARRKRDSETTENQVSVVSATPSLKRICVSKTHRSKTLHLPVDISDCIIEGLVDTGASMSVLAPAVVRELGIMHLVTWNESYKTTSRIVTQALGRVDEVQVKIGGVQCAMTFMVVDTDGYDVLLGLDFLMKIGAMVDVERGLIQVRHGPGTNVEVSPLTMVNLLQRMNADVMRSGTATFWKDAPANQGGDVQFDQDQKTIDGGDDKSVSDSDDESDNDEFHDSESNPLEQGDSNDEFVDAEFEELVNSEGPQEMLQLMLQEQTDGIMTEGNLDGDDYANWIKWSSDAEENRLSMRKSARDVLEPALLQQHKPNHDSVIPMILQTT